MSLTTGMSGWEDTSFHQCRWGFCRLSFLTLDSLERHVEDHLKRSEPVDRNAFKVTFRDGWYRGEEKKSIGLGSLIEQLGQHKKPRLSDFTQTTSSNRADSSTSGSTPAAIIVTSTSSFLHPSSRPYPSGSPPSQLQSQPHPLTISSDVQISPSQRYQQSRRSLYHKPGDLDIAEPSQNASSSISFVPSRESQAHAATRRPSTSGMTAEGGNQQLSAKIQLTSPRVKSQTGSTSGPPPSSIGKSRASTSDVKSSQVGSLTKKSRKKKKISYQSLDDATVEAAKPSSAYWTQTTTTTEAKEKVAPNSDEDILDLLVMDTPSPTSQPVPPPKTDVKYEEDENDVQILTGSPQSLRSIPSARSVQQDITPLSQETALAVGPAHRKMTEDSSLLPEKDIEMVDLSSSPPSSSRPSGPTSASVFSSTSIQPTEHDKQDGQDDPNVSLDSDLGIQTQVDVQAVMNFHEIPIPNHLFKIGPDSSDEEGSE